MTTEQIEVRTDTKEVSHSKIGQKWYPWMTIRLLEVSECPWITTIIKEVSYSIMDNGHAGKVSNGTMDSNQAEGGQ